MGVTTPSPSSSRFRSNYRKSTTSTFGSHATMEKPALNESEMRRAHRTPDPRGHVRRKERIGVTTPSPSCSRFHRSTIHGSTKRNINDQLIEGVPNLPSGTTPRWRNQHYMRVECDKHGLPTGNATSPGATADSTKKLAIAPPLLPPLNDWSIPQACKL